MAFGFGKILGFRFSTLGAWLVACVLSLLALASPLRAESNAPAVVLEVQLTDGQAFEFTLQALQALPQSEFTTSTVWTDAADLYSGVKLIDLLRHIGVTTSTGTVSAEALDGYHVTLDMANVTERGPLLAYLRNGAAMPVRKQGPIWLLFPFDDYPEYRTESFYSSSVWQLRKLRVRQ